MNFLSPRAAATSLAQLFVGPRRRREASTIELKGGEVLFGPGDPADQIYFLVAGRLGAIRRRGGRDAQFLGVVRPGEPVGEMAMLGSIPHTATVVALRDSTVMTLPRHAFLKALQQTPQVMSELARVMALRMRASGDHLSSEPSAFGFIAACEGMDVRGLAEAVAAEVRLFGVHVAVVGSDQGAGAQAEWFTTVEEANDLVLYVAQAQETAWQEVVARQVDHLFRIGRGEMEPPAPPWSLGAENLHRERLVDLILLQPAHAAKPLGASAWMRRAQATRLFHVRAGDRGDVQRLARLVSGRSIGLVLSGGAARAYAHIGAIKALRDARAPIDFIGGVSMGAIIGAGVALGWDEEELDARIRKAFVDSNPVADATLPLIALTSGRQVDQRLKEHFGDVEIPDLWRPFFCVSADLTTGAYRMHREGRLRDALRASASLPGVLPPVVEDGHVLVDGAVTGNFPTDLMRAEHRGPVIGCDVSFARGLTGDDVRRPGLIPWLLSGAWRKGPPLVSILIRSATIHSDQEMLAARRSADLVITPRIDNIEIRDWKAYDPAVHAGYVAAVEALQALERPLTDLRLPSPHHLAEIDDDL